LTFDRRLSTIAPGNDMETRPLIFDIETIADISAENHDDIADLARKREMTPEDYGGLCPPLARVVCIAWHDLAAGKLGACYDASLGGGTPPESIQVDAGLAGTPAFVCALSPRNGEADLLGYFGRLVEQHLAVPKGTLVTYSGRGFDLPVLIHRGCKHGVTAGRDLLVKAMGENRYRPSIHFDLLESATFFGATGRWPMAAYAIGYGWRSPKREMHGSQVFPAVQAGRILDVVRYCATDVLATAHIYTSFQLRSPAKS
jgi:hypothetical protein